MKKQELENALEFERMRLAACGTAAMCNTKKSARQQRIKKSNPYYSASYGDVCRAVDREMRYRKALEDIIHELGVPGEGYPAPVANAYDAAAEALDYQPRWARG
jgi:hypothetical protein